MGDVAGRGQVEQSFEVPYNVRFEIIRGVEACGRSYTGEEGEHPGTIEDYAGVVVLLNDLEQISHIRIHQDICGRGRWLEGVMPHARTASTSPRFCSFQEIFSALLVLL